MADIFLDGSFIGTTDKPEEVVQIIREKRRSGQISDQVNVTYLEHLDQVMILTDSGRARRPLIVVENGKPKLTKEHLEKIREKKLTWNDLIKEGVIEYLDAEEEENAFVALRPEDLTEHHTHLELDPAVILGLSTSLLPFPEFDRGDRVNFGSKMIGQSIGMYSFNFPMRVDTKANVLVFSQLPLVKTHMNDILKEENHPSGKNVIVAVMSYEGYNMDDAIVMSKSSIERGLFWSYLFKTYEAEKKRYMGGQEDVIGIPEPGIRGYAGEDAYKHLPKDGIINPETEVKEDEVLIGKVSPLRFLGSLDQFITGLENIRETSVKLKHGEGGIVDRVFVTESGDGNKLIKVIVRDLKKPEIGDKFASRHGQKGVIGLIVPQEDMPFNEDGSVPDIVFNPHGIPSRMTMGQLMEMLAGKVAALLGKRLSSPAFHFLNESWLRETLEKKGYRNDGKETLYDGQTGRKYIGQIFMGSAFYQKLDHLVSNKIHARSRGPVTLLTKQPTEGKSKKGGLRLGEMEKDCLIAHGASLALKERFDSDKTRVPICRDCGLVAIVDRIRNRRYCQVCEGSKVVDVEMSYAFKLLTDELKCMLIYPKLVVNEETNTLNKIVFGVLSPEIIRKMSAAKIIKTELYDQEGYPIEGGLMDPRLGVIDPGLRCRTCGGTAGECQGHFGHLELTKPVINVHYAKLIFTLLKGTCSKCGRVLLDENGIKKFMTGKKSLKKLKSLLKSKCPYCGTTQKKLKFMKPTTFIEDGTILDVSQVRERLQRIPDSDLIYFGMRGLRPEFLVITLLPIPPVTVRPSITLETGERSEDDLTHKLVDIVRINKRLAENIELGAPEFIIEDLWELLQYHVATYMNNELSGVPPARHRSGRILKTLTQRLKTKEGRFRHNLIGKRVNYSARTVISPDPLLDINEVGVPLIVAKELTKSVVVNEKNIEKLREMIRRYPDWPTVNYVIRPDGRKKKVNEANKEEIAKEIEIGYVVEKQLEDGDWSLFNRQPSLHRMSMMGHRVRVMPYKTFRLNLLVCPPYNADFDGDEMNLHIPQLEEAQTETKLLMDVPNHIRSPRFSGPIIGCSKDHITALYLLTHGHREFTRKEVVELLRLRNIDLEIPNKNKFTGKDVFSLFLPKDFNTEYKATCCIGCKKCLKEKCPYDAYVVVKNGQLINGTIDKKSISAFSGKMLDELDKKYGHEFARKFLFDITRFALAYLTRYGFSVSVADHDLDEKIRKKINETIESVKKEIDKIIKDFKKGKIRVLIGRTPRESLEILIKRKLAESLNKVADAVEKSVPENNTVIMARSGARGSMINMIQCAACIGQELIKGERIKIGFYKRTFTHFRRGDISLESKGFVKHGYKDGLNPFEFFFDAMNSREGLMDKSLKTRHSGYLERRLIGALQDLKIEYDRTVRDSGKRIIQFVPGEDGLDPSKIQRDGIDVGKIADRIFS
jgi:DNA-directed RNA polymerase subunit A'